MFGAYSFGLNLRLDFTVLALTVALMLTAILAAGLAPALYASSPGVAQILSGEIVVGGTGKGARRNALVMVQVAVCTLVLMGLGLCQRNLYNLRHADMGFTARNLVAMTAYLASEGYSEAQGRQAYRNFRRAVSALPGVESVSLARDLPLQGGSEISVNLPGGKKISILHTVVDADYFGTFGIPVFKGRVFNSSDQENGPETAVINRRMAETFWPGQDPLGKQLLTGETSRKVTVVGVVADGKYEDLEEQRRLFLYLALSQHYQGGIQVIARTGGDPRGWVEQFDRAIRAQGLKTPVRPATFENWLHLSLLPQRMAAGIVAALSGLGLLLASMGLAGAVAYSVSQRRRELGIRVALGARSGQLVRMVLRQVLLIAATGVAAGLLLGTGASVVLRSQFYRIGIVEWTVLIPVSGLVLAVSLVVAWFSARPWI
ncbi:MAG: hypothetical protein QOJ99_1703, partial [Bryobacterales bacterium]|nr:hypothetical protein [Bryobacterales bacterium]